MTTNTETRCKAYRVLQACVPAYFGSPDVTPGVEWACRDIGVKPPARRARWLGITGGDHIFRDSSGCVWQVDLVCETASLCVGLPPSQWGSPPRQ